MVSLKAGKRKDDGFDSAVVAHRSMNGSQRNMWRANEPHGPASAFYTEHRLCHSLPKRSCGAAGATLLVVPAADGRHCCGESAHSLGPKLSEQIGVKR
mmetsp:Transcript_4820/g.12118  ORF Transcript_4820/g.12118 Transcript_4820/m.12118 type:complete len:98 (-) Transcript_4820:33-326(-)